MTGPLLLDIQTHKDPRGSLSVVDIPLFERVFWVRDCKGMRGRHRHLSCWQLLIPIIGAFLIITSKDGLGKKEYTVEATHDQGVLVPPGWCISYVAITEPNAILVLATESYDKDIIIPCEEEGINESGD
jgi:dTDP-4-dehydrorhamnose 3,5-epimerase-like enzyme